MRSRRPHGGSVPGPATVTELLTTWRDGLRFGYSDLVATHGPAQGEGRGVKGLEGTGSPCLGIALQEAGFVEGNRGGGALQGARLLRAL